MAELSDRLLECQERVSEMERYAYPRFDMSIQSIIRNSRSYLRKGDSTNRQKAYGAFSEIEDFFAGIPLDVLHSSWEQAHEPLQVIYKLLPMFRIALDKVFEERSGHAFNSLKGFANIMIGFNVIYEQHIAKYRNMPTMQDNISISLKGRVYYPLKPSQIQLQHHNDN